jgi:putative transposase
VYRFMRAEEANHSVRLMCRVLRVSRSGYYDWRRGRTYGASRNSEIMCWVKAVHRKHKGRYGAPRIAAELRAQGHIVNRKRIARLMREQGLAGRPAKRRRPKALSSRHSLRTAPNLLQRVFTEGAPRRVVVADITYLRTRAGWVYLAVLIDLFSRKVVGWSLQSKMETSLCLEALEKMVGSGQFAPGAIHHSDRGSQYQSAAYRAELRKAGFRQSMSRTGDCWDNAVAESFFGTLKQELAVEVVWQNRAEAHAAVSEYIHAYYNATRRHSTLGYLSPNEYEERFGR